MAGEDLSEVLELEWEAGRRALQVSGAPDPPVGRQETHPGMILILVPYVAVETGHSRDVLSDRALLGCTYRSESGR
jgi:hypothetical protein